MTEDERAARVVARSYELDLVERVKALADECDEDARDFDKSGQWGFARLEREHADYLRSLAAEFDTPAVIRRLVVTSAQARAAQAIVKQMEGRSEAVPDRVRQIAEARICRPGGVGSG